MEGRLTEGRSTVDHKSIFFFVSDLHGSSSRYRTLFERIREERPGAVFFGGDLLPSGMAALTKPDFDDSGFINQFLARELAGLREALGDGYPRIFVILGNDDARSAETAVSDAAARGLWDYIHNGHSRIGSCTVFGYSYVPPTPFLLKDWERYDVSRYVDPGCVSPEEGYRSVRISDDEKKYATIKEDLETLTGNHKMDRAIFLFHTPPYRTNLDRAALDGRMIDHVPLDVNVGSIAVRRFIEERQPLVTLHGHVHESAKLTGSWKDRIGRTHCFSAANGGPELALVRFDPACPDDATCELLER